MRGFFVANTQSTDGFPALASITKWAKQKKHPATKGGETKGASPTKGVHAKGTSPPRGVKE